MKIYVTGLGVVSGIGIGVSENIEALRQGRHGIGKVTLFPTALDVPVSEVKRSNEELKRMLSISPQRTVSRTALLGMLAAGEALADSGLDIKSPLRIGLISATSVGGMDLSEHFYESFRQNPSRGRLREVISHDCGASTELIAAHLEIKDFVTTISTACSSAANAIMLGARMIKFGQLDAAIVGGTDALCRFTLNGFNSLMILDKEHCRPFDRSRAGLNLGEGAGFLVLQSEKTLQRTPYCVLTGYANTNEAYHQTGSSPEGDGAFSSMNEAITSGGISPADIDYINVHGTGTPGNDASEGAALRRIFGDRVPPFSSVKAFIGHTLGASEGIEAVYSVLSIYKGMIYPNMNFREAMPETGLTPETTFREGLPIRHVLSNSFGFGGNDSSLLFSADSGEHQEDIKLPQAVAVSPIYIRQTASIHPQGNPENRPYLSACEPDYKGIITNATLRRRMSRIVKMGVACGLECIAGIAPESIQGIITATGLGCLADTEKFLNTLIENEERMLNPTPFIQSTFNTIGAQIALFRQIHAYNMTYVHRGLSFESALLDGMLKIWEGADNILVGAFDEMTDTSYAIQQRLGLLKDVQAGEGAQFFLLSREPGEHPLAELIGVETFAGQQTAEEINTRISGFLQRNGLKTQDIHRLMTGKNMECGEYPTASAYAVWKAVEEAQQCDRTTHILIYNHHHSIHHSLILVRKSV